MIDLTCADRACGGFDFRHRIDMGQSPEMHVDIGNFRYLAARKRRADTVAVTVSQGGLTLYVHVVHVGDGTARRDMGHAVDPHPLTDETEAVAPTADLPPGEAIARLVESGAVPLDDLRFRTGASELSGTTTPPSSRSPRSSPKTPGAVWSSWAIPMPRAGATATSRSARRAPVLSAAT
jgi:hypothetical protein